MVAAVAVGAGRGGWSCDWEQRRVGRLGDALVGFFLQRGLQRCVVRRLGRRDGIVVEARHEILARIAFE